MRPPCAASTPTPGGATPLREFSRELGARPAVRLVHLGLGAFHRSHQVWHTAVADPELQWGYASFTGRSARVARSLVDQDGLYTVVTRSGSGDRADVVRHLRYAHDGEDLAQFSAYLADPSVVVVTLTVTEAGYHLDRAGRLDLADPMVLKDVALLRQRVSPVAQPLRTVLARLLYGLQRRRQAAAGPLTVMPCDNLPSNGRVVSRAIHDLAAEIDPALAEWIERNVEFASSVVDRITPATTPEDIAGLAGHDGMFDPNMVVTEPFSEWIIAGQFPAGRPAWERSGVRLVDDVEPYERRKLWMLNGAHTLLATMARPRGYTTVADAVADPAVRDLLDDYWDTVQTWLPEPELDIPTYRRNLVDRFANPRIVHHLDQVAVESTTKIRYRIVPVVLAERAAGRMPHACLRPIAAWMDAITTGIRDSDSANQDIDDAVRDADSRASVRHRLLSLVDPRLAADDEILRTLHELTTERLRAADAP